MKILIIQLARLGDIYQTWPIVRALRRNQPEAKIQILTRQSFSQACTGLTEVDRVWEFDSHAILRPLIDERPQIQQSLRHVGDLIEDLSEQKFDRVINLTFSPLSSFITHALQTTIGPSVEIRGYTRHSDGYLAIADDASAYFYAQVGPGRENRFHLTEIMAQVADVELKEEDWRRPHFNKSTLPLDDYKNAIVVHVGASEAKKTYGSNKWLQVVRGLLENSERPVVLIGSRAETAVGQVLENVTGLRKPVNLVGQTKLTDLFELISSAALLIGCDSAPVHIAALTNTSVLNLSFSSVNFWETGPKSAGSRILVATDPEALASSTVINEALALLGVQPQFQLSPEHRFIEQIGETAIVTVPGKRTEAYLAPRTLSLSPAWEMLQAVYMGMPFPVPGDELFVEALARLSETNALALEQIQALKRNSQNEIAVAILQRCDEILDTLQKASPVLAIVIRWFQAERTRLPPGTPAAVITATESLHHRLSDILNLYDFNEGVAGYDDIGME